MDGKVNLHFVEVEQLPHIEEAEDTAIYLLPKDGAENVYDVFVVTVKNDARQYWKLGDTTIDLTGYIREEDIVFATNADIDEVFGSLFEQ